MLKRTFEWCRIFTAQPNDELVSKRQLASQSLIEHLDDSSNKDLLFACPEGCIKGFTQNSEAVKTIVACIKTHQPAFPADLSENAIELQVCAMLALGEIVIRPINNDSNKRKSAILTSALLISGIGLRPKLQEKYLQIALNELYDAALSATNQAALNDRQRVALNLGNLLAISVDVEQDNLWKELRPLLIVFFTQIEEQAAQTERNFKFFGGCITILQKAKISHYQSLDHLKLRCAVEQRLVILCEFLPLKEFVKW